MTFQHVSIFLPTFRRLSGGYLHRAIKSVLDQTFRDYELFVVDDGSTDGSADLIRNFAKRDSRVRHIRFERNVGLPALTTGLTFCQSTGDLIAFIFDDCVWRNNHLSTFVAEASAHPGAGLYYGRALSHWPNDGVVAVGKPYNAGDMANGNNHVPNVSAIIRREVIEKVGWYDPHVVLKRFCDWDLWVRIAHEHKVRFVDEIVADEYGTSLRDSLGESASIEPELMLAYAGTFRDRLLHPNNLGSYDPLRFDILSDMSVDQTQSVRFLVLEHLLRTGDERKCEEVFASDLQSLQIEYFAKRAERLASERQNFQFSLFQANETIRKLSTDLSSAAVSAEESRLTHIRELEQAQTALNEKAFELAAARSERDERTALVDRISKTAARGRRREILLRARLAQALHDEEVARGELEPFRTQVIQERSKFASAYEKRRAALTSLKAARRQALDLERTVTNLRMGLAALEAKRYVVRNFARRLVSPMSLGRPFRSAMHPSPTEATHSAAAGGSSERVSLRVLDTSEGFSASNLARSPSLSRRTSVSSQRGGSRFPNGSALTTTLNVLFIADGPVTSLALLLIPFDYMRASFGVTYSVYFERSLPPSEEWIVADLVVLMRARLRETADLAEQLRAEGIPIINVTDDDFVSLAEESSGDPAKSAIAANIEALGGTDVLRRTALASDLTLVFSQSLQSFFSQYGLTEIAPAVCGVEYYLSLGISNDPRHKKEVRIGYAGSPTHQDDVAVVEDVLNEVLDTFGESVFVETIGQRMPKLSGHPRYRHFEAVPDVWSYMKLQSERAWDIALAPLLLTKFNQSKSDNKYRSYAAAGVAGIYSKIASFEASVKHGETGLVVENDHQAWLNAISSLITNPVQRSSIAVAARNDVSGRYSVAEVAYQYHRRIVDLVSRLRVLAVGPLALPTFSIDVRRPMQALAAQSLVRTRYREVEAVTEHDLFWADLVVIVRAGEPGGLAVLRRAQAIGRKVVFSWDDDLFAITPEVSGLYEHYTHPEIRQSFEEVLRKADLVKVSTERLATTTRHYSNRILVAPYGFDFSLLPNPLPPRRSSTLTIGYYGSPGRGSEFDVVIAALNALSRDYNNIKIEMFGHRPHNMDAQANIEFLPYMESYEESIWTLAQRRWDIGLAPLALTELCRAKLPTKYRDYGAVRAAGVYTKIEPYTDVIENGRNGVIVKNTVSGWYAGIATLIENARLRESIAETAHADVYQNLALDRAVDAWLEVFRRCGLLKLELWAAAQLAKN